MKQRLDKAVFHLILALAWAGILSITSHGAVDRHWTGEVGQFWTSPANWSNNVAPVAGDNLFFSGRPLNQITVNNYAANTVFGKMTVSPGNVSAFTLGGAPIVLSNGMAVSGTPLSGGTTVTADIGIGPGVQGDFEVFSVARSLTISNLNLNENRLLLDVSGSMTILGTVTTLPSFSGFVRLLKTNTGTLWIPGGTRSAASLNVVHGSARVDGMLTNAENPASIRVVATPGRSASLSGTGVVDLLTVENGGVLRPGNNGAGIFESRTSVEFNHGTGGILQATLNGTAEGTDYGQLVARTVILDGGYLDVHVGYASQVGDTFRIIRAASYVAGSFPNVSGGLLDTTNGYSLGVLHNLNDLSLKTARRPDSPFVLWKGTGPNPQMSLTTNWAQGVGPLNGSHVHFAGYGSFGPRNDLPPETALGSVAFSAGSYTLAEPLTVTQGITNAPATTNSCAGGLVVVGPLVLHADAGGALIVGGSFNGSGPIRKEGAGTLRYVGTTMNSFVGSFVVNAGTFQVDGSLTDGSMAVNGGVLQGTGTVSAVTMNGGTLNPGVSPGIFHIEGNLAMAPAAVFKAELNGAVPGTGYDQLQVNGAVNLNGATLNLQPGFNPAVGTAFLILVNDGNDAISGTFAGLPESAAFSAGGQDFTITYKAGSGSNDVVVVRTAPATRLLPLTRVDPNSMRLQGTGSGGGNYTIQANTNLGTTNWSNIGSVSADGAGAFQFLDTNVQQFPRRFYRTRSP